MRLLITFGGLSLIGTAAQYLTLWLWVTALSGHAWWGSVVGASLGLVVNFVLHSRITFAGSDQRGWAAFCRFFLSALSGFVTNAAVMAAILALAWHWLAAQLIATLCAFAVNFLMAKFWVFKHRPHPASPTNSHDR